MAKKYEKIDFGTGDNTPTGDTINAGFKKINTALNDIENDIESVESDLITLNNKVDTVESTLTTQINDVDDSIDNRISTQITNLIDGAPATFDTLKEIADWIENDGVDVVDLTSAIANKADKSQLNGLATETFVTDAIGDIDIPEVDLSNYYNISQVDNLINVAQSPIVLNNNNTLTMTNGAHIQQDNPNVRTNNVELIPWVRSGWNNGCKGSHGVSIGSNSTCGEYGVAIGSGVRGDGNNGVAIGANARTSNEAVVVGAGSTAYNRSIVLGHANTQTSLINDTITLSNNLFVNGENSINIGFEGTKNDGVGGVAIGNGVYNSTEGGVKLGKFNIKDDSLFAIGSGTSNTTRSNAFKINVDKKATFYNVASYDQSYKFTTDNELVTKKYVDDAVANGGGSGGGSGSDSSTAIINSTSNTAIINELGDGNFSIEKTFEVEFDLSNKNGVEFNLFASVDKPFASHGVVVDYFIRKKTPTNDGTWLLCGKDNDRTLYYTSSINFKIIKGIFSDTIVYQKKNILNDTIQQDQFLYNRLSSKFEEGNNTYEIKMNMSFNNVDVTNYPVATYQVNIDYGRYNIKYI